MHFKVFGGSFNASSGVITSPYYDLYENGGYIEAIHSWSPFKDKSFMKSIWTVLGPLASNYEWSIQLPDPDLCVQLSIENIKIKSGMNGHDDEDGSLCQSQALQYITVSLN